MIEQPTVRRVCDVGGGANPVLSLEYIRHPGLEYTLLDASTRELTKAPPGYRTVEADISDPKLELPGGYDLVLSRWLAEHVRRPADFHRNIFDLLVPGGWAIHLFSTLYGPPFVANRLIGERFARRILGRLSVERHQEGAEGKFPALYRWCRGPTRRQLARLESTGFRIDSYTGFFGHGYYQRLPPLDRLSRSIARYLVRHPISILTTYAIVVLQRP